MCYPARTGMPKNAPCCRNCWKRSGRRTCGWPTGISARLASCSALPHVTASSSFVSMAICRTFSRAAGNGWAKAKQEWCTSKRWKSRMTRGTFVYSGGSRWCSTNLRETAIPRSTSCRTCPSESRPCGSPSYTAIVGTSKRPFKKSRKACKAKSKRWVTRKQRSSVLHGAGYVQPVIGGACRRPRGARRKGGSPPLHLLHGT